MLLDSPVQKAIPFKGSVWWHYTTLSKSRLEFPIRIQLELDREFRSTSNERSVSERGEASRKSSERKFRGGSRNGPANRQLDKVD